MLEQGVQHPETKAKLKAADLPQLCGKLIKGGFGFKDAPSCGGNASKESCEKWDGFPAHGIHVSC